MPCFRLFLEIVCLDTSAHGQTVESHIDVISPLFCGPSDIGYIRISGSSLMSPSVLKIEGCEVLL